MKNELVSIIIPAYNAKQAISKCLNSIINQTYNNIEIIIIDDGSQDGTAQWIESNYKGEQNIKLIRQENQGPSVARNNGIKQAKGQYILFVDSDDFLSQNFIEEILKHYKSNMLNGGCHNSIEKNKIKPNYPIDAIGNTMYVDIISGRIGGFICGYLFERELITDLQFDTSIRFMEDVLFLLAYCQKVKGIHFVPNAIYYYVYNSSGLSKSKENVLKNMKYMDIVVNQIEIFLIENKVEIGKNFIREKKLRLIDAELGKLNRKSEVEKIINDHEFKKVIQNIELDKSSKLFWRIYRKTVVSNKMFAVVYLKLRRLLKKIKGGV